MTRVFDCFIYCDEADTLEIRLNELDHLVDRFVLCEATRTFTNQPKPLHFLEQRNSFARFLPKITHVIVDDFPPELTSTRDLKHYQRNALTRGLADCTSDDVVIISDADEIPHPDAIRTFEGPVSGLRMRLFNRYLNLEAVAGAESTTVRSVISRYDYMGSPQQLRTLGRSNHVLNKIVENGGWHFSHLGDTKWLSCDADFVWDFVPVDESYPAFVVSNWPRYERLIAQSALGTRPRGDPFSSIYFEQERPEVLAMVPRDVRRVLELGCATGKLGVALKRRQECQIVGVEYAAEAAERASTCLDQVIVGDCENLDLEALFQPGEFDCLIAADVLEHLRDPESLLRRLQPFLSPHACIVVSLPNIRHAGVLEAAVQGYWSYQQWGILDRTHLRFFTRREIDNMFARLGFQVEERRTVDDASLAEWEGLGRPISPTFGALTVNGLDEQEIREFFVFQWLVRARSSVRPRRSLPIATPEDSGGIIELDTLSLDGLVPHVSVAANEIQELRLKLNREQVHAQGIQAELIRRDEQLIDRIRESERLQTELIRHNEELADKQRQTEELRSDLTRRSEELADKDGQAEGWHRQLVQHKREHQMLAASHQRLVRERDIALRELEAVRASTSWRLTAPLRSVTRRRPTLGGSIRGLLRGRPRTQRALRRAKRLMWLAVTLQLPGRVAARLRARLAANTEAAGRAIAPAAVHEVTDPSAVVYSARPIAFRTGPVQLAGGERRRLICMTHVLPYPTRAGNEYRIHHMLSWLAGLGWDVLLLVYPLPDEPTTSSQITEAAEQYPNLVVCCPDGTLLYRLRNGGAMLEGLLGRRPRVFASLLNETEDTRPGASNLLSLMRKICPDVLIEVLLHLEAEFEPAVLLAEYVFMTRPFALLRPGLLKVVDTIDVLSTKQAKLTQYGVDDGFALTPELESELLNRTDVVIAIQAAEAKDLRKLAPRRQVISVGVDFSLVEHVPPPAARPIILLVGSGNPANVKGLNDFLRFAWPLIRKEVPQAQLHVIGSVGNTLDRLLAGIRILGRVEDLATAYSEARVVINPTIAGTGLKIKTVEALCNLRPVVLWPAGVDGLGPELRELCHVATDWFDFARRVIELASTSEGARALIDRRPELARQFAPDSVYAPLEAALACR